MQIPSIATMPRQIRPVRRLGFSDILVPSREMRGDIGIYGPVWKSEESRGAGGWGIKVDIMGQPRVC